jgi:hypothetical protein
LIDAVALAAPEAAVIVAFPAEPAVTNPEALTVATAWLLEDHVTRVATSCAVPSLKMPVALNWLVCPAARLAELGRICREDSVAAVTVKAMVPEIVPTVAVTVTLPTFRAVNKPELPTVAIVESDDCHVVDEEASFVLLSL